MHFANSLIREISFNPYHVPLVYKCYKSDFERLRHKRLNHLPVVTWPTPKLTLAHYIPLPETSSYSQ